MINKSVPDFFDVACVLILLVALWGSLFYFAGHARDERLL